MAFLIFVSSAN